MGAVAAWVLPACIASVIGALLAMCRFLRLVSVRQTREISGELCAPCGPHLHHVIDPETRVPSSHTSSFAGFQGTRELVDDSLRTWQLRPSHHSEESERQVQASGA